MKLSRLGRFVLLTSSAIFLMTGSASAAFITFNTDSADTGFEGGGLTLENTFGADATLAFEPNSDVTVGTPSNVNLGAFVLACPDCSTRDSGVGATFAPFVFHLVVTSVSDNATGRLVGTSAGGTVFSNASPISIRWSPLQLGPETDNALSGDFGFTTFTTTGFTGIIAPNTGWDLGRTTVQGYVSSVAVADSSQIPEPATWSLVLGAVLGLALVRRRNGSALTSPTTRSLSTRGS
jgi:hypothetical protein